MKKNNQSTSKAIKFAQGYRDLITLGNDFFGQAGRFEPANFKFRV